MRCSILLLAAILVGCAATPSTPPPPTATDASITVEKYHYLRNGMTLAECNRIMGSAGRQTSMVFSRDYVGRPIGTGECYTWGDETKRPYIDGYFSDGRMTMKIQVGLTQPTTSRVP